MCFVIDLLIVVLDPSIQPFPFVILFRVVRGLDLGEKTKRRRRQPSLEYKHNMFITRPVEEKNPVSWRCHPSDASEYKASKKVTQINAISIYAHSLTHVVISVAIKGQNAVVIYMKM